MRISFFARVSLGVMLLLLLVIGSLAGALQQAAQQALERHAQEQLNIGARVFERLLALRSQQLQDEVRILSSDFGFRDAVASADVPTLRSALRNHGDRAAASEVLLLDLQGQIKASTSAAFAEGQPFAYAQALLTQLQNPQHLLVVPVDGVPHLLAAATVRAPLPVAVLIMGFEIDRALADELRQLTHLEVTLLVQTDNSKPRWLSTLLNAPAQQLELLRQLDSDSRHWQPLVLAGEHYLSLAVPLSEAADYQISAFLHRPLNAVSAALLGLRERLLSIAGLAFGASLLLALLLARTVARPLERLARSAQRIGQGDYQAPIERLRVPELAALGAALGQMQHGIAERERQLAHNALHEPHSGLPNRTLLEERINSAIAAERPLGVLLIGVANFSEWLSARSGDAEQQLAQALAQQLLELRRPGLSVARLLDDRFAVLLEEASAAELITLADQCQQRLSQLRDWQGEALGLQVHIGVASYPQDAHSSEALLHCALAALHEAQMHHEPVQVYEQAKDAARQRQIILVRDLRQAAERGELQLHYQPKLNLRDGQIRQAEALLRWQHAELGWVSPGEFIPLAERTGSIAALTRWVIEAAVAQIAQWHAQGLVMQVSVNVSAADLAAFDVCQVVEQALSRHQLAAQQLVLEITESAVMQDQQHALAVLQALRELGVGLSVDDFGTGYSSLAQLRQLPVQELKIDQTFIRQLGPEGDDAVIVRSTIEMSHRLGLKVVAEGIESALVLELLRDWGCDVAQGYYISRPVPASALQAWLASDAAQVLQG